MAKHTKKSGIAKTHINRGSILWRAVLHSVLLSTLIIVVLSAISYTFILTMVQRGSIGVEIYDLMQYGAQLGKTLLIVGGVFLMLAIVLSFSFGRKLTQPFLEMQKKVEHIKPGHWKYQHTIHTKDEAEALDKVISSLTKRLHNVYTDQESIIEDRTEQLKEEYAKDRTILQAIHVGILVVDKEGVVLQTNPAAASLLKRTEKELVKQFITNLLPMRKHEKAVPKTDHPVFQALKNREEISISPESHLNVVLKSGETLPVKISVTPLIKNRKLLGAVVLFQDVTMERQMDYMKTDFITIASHHLRTPLSTVQWYLELLATDQKEGLTKDQKSFIVEMRMATKKMTSVLGELMDASRISEEGFTPVYADVNLNNIIQDVVRGAQPLLDSKNIEYNLQAMPTGVFVHTDPLLAGIILQNLVHNAVKYSRQEGKSKINVRLEKKKNAIRVLVQDNGIGIPYAEQEYIFEKLYRASNARSVESNGADLGLYSCKMLADRMGASLSFESKEDEGSTFVASFPISKKSHKKKTHSTKKRA